MSLDLRPRIRPGLRYVPQVQDGRKVVVVKDTVRLSYFRFGEPETFLMRRMDGARSLEDLAHDYAEEFGERVTPDSIGALVRRLKELGLAERSSEEKSILLMESLRTQRKDRLQGKGNTLMRMRFSFGDPDLIFDRIIGHIRFLFTPAFVVFSLITFAAFLLIISVQWGAFKTGLAMMYDPAQYTVAFVVVLYATTLVVTVLHELAHGLTCKNFGGEVHEVGAMLLYLTPSFYCNVNDAWTFDRRSHRLWVTFAGSWIELIIAAFAAVAWLLLEPGTFPHQVALATVLVAGGLSVLVNFNPLIPLDGYYALMDWLEIPNLRPRALAYVSALFRNKVLGLDVAVPALTPREKRVFLTYGTLSFLYTTIILTVVAVFAGRFLIASFGGWGAAVFLLLLVLLLRRPAAQTRRMARVWYADRGAIAGFARRRLLLAGGGIAVLALILVLPWTVKAKGEVVLEPVARSWIRPADGGWIGDIRVAEGQVVAPGDTLLILQHPELSLEALRARATVGAAGRLGATAMATRRSSDMRLAELEMETGLRELAEVERRVRAMAVLAPIAGRVATKRPAESLGLWAAPGDSILEIWGEGSNRLRVRLAERDAAVREGAAVSARFPSAPSLTLHSRVAQVAPAAEEGWVEVLAPAPDTDASGYELRPGIRGLARVEVEKTTVGRALYRSLRRLIRVDWLL